VVEGWRADLKECKWRAGRRGRQDRRREIERALEDFVVREEDNVLDFLLRHDAHRTLDL